MGWSIWPPPVLLSPAVFFSKNVFSRERVKSWFFVTFTSQKKKINFKKPSIIRVKLWTESTVLTMKQKNRSHWTDSKIIVPEENCPPLPNPKPNPNHNRGAIFLESNCPRHPPEVFCKKKLFLKNIEMFTGKHLCWSLFFNKV